MNLSRFWILFGMIVVAAITRLIPHPPNMTAMTAMALFGGAHFEKKHWSFMVPFAALFLSDLILGLHDQMLFVYLSFALIVALGFWVNRKKVVSVLGTSLLASTLFFITTNFAVWLLGSFYSKDLSGLISCYTMALPFFENALLGDLFYTGVLFGTFAFLEKRFLVLQQN